MAAESVLRSECILLECMRSRVRGHRLPELVSALSEAGDELLVVVTRSFGLRRQSSGSGTMKTVLLLCRGLLLSTVPTVAASEAAGENPLRIMILSFPPVG